MALEFDRDFWDEHWGEAGATVRSSEPSPHLLREVGDLTPGFALDAGCGEGAEAIWLADRGWTVTAADISRAALSRAADRATRAGAASDRIDWTECDLGIWSPGRQFDLVTTHYAHLPTSQLAFYERISEWVAPGGTLLIVGHLQSSGTAEHGHRHGHGGHPPAEATVTAESVTALLAPDRWRIETAAEPVREITTDDGTHATIGDVVVRATRLR